MTTEKLTKVPLRIITAVAALYLAYTLYAGSGISERERAVFWASAAGLAIAVGLAWWMGRRNPYWITASAVVGVMLVAFLTTLVIYRDPPLLRFGNALALSIGNAVTLGIATWLIAGAVFYGRRMATPPGTSRLRTS